MWGHPVPGAGAQSFDDAIQDRSLDNLINVRPDLCEQVAANIGRPVPAPAPIALEVDVSPALSMQVLASGSISGRVVGIMVGDGVKKASVDKVALTLVAAGTAPRHRTSPRLRRAGRDPPHVPPVRLGHVRRPRCGSQRRRSAHARHKVAVMLH